MRKRRRRSNFAPGFRFREIRATLPKAIANALVSPQVAARFAKLNIESRQNTPEEFRAYVEAQMQLWSRVVKEAHIRLGLTRDTAAV